MNEARIFIGYPSHRNIIENNSDYTFIINEKDDTDFQIDIKEKYLTIFQDIRRRRIKHVRYIFLSAVDRNYGQRMFKVFEWIVTMHKKMLQITFETEFFLIIPSIISDEAIKASAYQFLIGLAQTNNATEINFLWLIDSDQVDNSLLEEVFDLYLGTEKYRSFNTNVSRELTGQQTIFHSTLGATKLVFPIKKWQQYLAQKLNLDFLRLSKFTSFPIDESFLRTILSSTHKFLHGHLDAMISEINKPVKFESFELFLKEHDIVEEKTFEEYLNNLSIYIEDRISKQHIRHKKLLVDFTASTIAEVERQLDSSAHGPHSALAFLGLLLGSSGLTYEYLISQDKFPEKTTGISLWNYLNGWQSYALPSPIFVNMFREVKKRLIDFVNENNLPVSWACINWFELQKELSKLVNILNAKMETKEFASELGKVNEIVETIVDMHENPFAFYTPDLYLKKLLNIFNNWDKEKAECIIREQLIEKLELENKLNEQLNISGWSKLLPSFKKLKKEKDDLEKDFISLKEEITNIYLKNLKMHEDLFSCFVASSFYQNLSLELHKTEKELQEFINIIESNKSELTSQIANTKFESNMLEINIIREDDEIKKLYYNQFNSTELPALFEIFFQCLQGEPSRLSHFYKNSVNRDKFEFLLGEYCLSHFSWIESWDIEKVIRYLQIESRCAYDLLEKCEYFLRFRQPAPENVRNSNYIALFKENSSIFNNINALAVSTGFYSHGHAEYISMIKLLHGFPIEIIEGWEDWKDCALSNK